MKALKWIAVGVGAVAALAVAIVVLVFALTGGAVDAAEAFLTHVGNGRYEEAYRSTAPQFRSNQDLAAFRAAAQRHGIDKYESASWNSREVTNGRATLEGTIRTKGGGRLPAAIVLVKSDGAWFVYSLRFSEAGVSPGDRAPAGAPDSATMKRMALRALLDFNDALQRRDFASFHAGLARPMREKYTPQALQGVFQAFIDQKIDLAPIRAVEPVFEPAEPRVSASGELALKGRFPTQPSQVHFDLSYVMEGGQWRLIGINVRVK